MHKIYDKIYADPEFQALQKSRSRFSWSLAALMLGSYVTYILLIAFRPDLLAVPLGPDTIITWGIPIAVAVMGLGFVLTGIYVYRSNAEYDTRSNDIIRRYVDRDDA